MNKEFLYDGINQALDDYYSEEIDKKYNDLIYEIAFYKRERDEYKKLYLEMKDKYNKLLNESIHHNEVINSHLLVAALNGAFNSENKNKPIKGD